MQDEILAGLKNAVEHEATLEQAMQSFINAGYNAQEVKAAGRAMIEGASEIVSMPAFPNASEEDKKEIPLPKLPEIENKREALMWENNQNKETKSSGKSGRTILIVSIIAFLIALLGFLVYLAYGLTSE
ncbi:hypothetical protein HYV50_01900 [Candidatus Pacearchaeota archaeon]|nr:hypothetical protein [Candidatus Pacearchaeota archaeon]